MTRSIVRIALVVALTAGILVPELLAPVHAITRPITLSRHHEFRPSQRSGALALGLPATHAMLSWTGPEGSGVAFRYDDDGSFTRWRRAPESHDMEKGRRRYSSPLLLDRALELEWRAFGGARGVTLDYVNTLDGPRRRIVVPTVARAGAVEPRIVTRAEWGADESLRKSRGCKRTFYPVQQLFVHHTVTSNNDPNPAATVRAIYHFHVQSRGWCDIGYNFLAAQNGQIFEGRWARSYMPWEVHDGEDRAGRVVSGAHVSGYNSGSVGISVLGNYTEWRIRKATRRSLVRLLAWEADRHNLKPTGRHTYRSPVDGRTKYLPYIAGHRDAGDTSCPGTRLYRALPSIRKSVARKVGAGKISSVLKGSPSEPITAGETSVSRFRLTKGNGVPLGDRRIDFYRKGAGAWASAGRARTNDRGWVRLELVPRRNLKIAAAWRGDARRWGDEAFLRQLVRPLVTVQPEGALESGPGAYRYESWTDEFFIGGRVHPKHSGHKVIIRTWQRQDDSPYVRLDDRLKKLDGTSSYRAKVTVPETGATYRFKTVLRKHDDHAAGRSAAVEVTVPPPLIPVPDP